MSEQVKVAVVYYSSTGTVYELAKSIVEGAEKAGAEVRLRKVHELASDEAIAANAGWASHAAEAQHVAEATAEDILWADAGSPGPDRDRSVGVAGLDRVEAMPEFVRLAKVETMPHIADEAGVVWKRFEVTAQSIFVLIDAAGEITFRGRLSADEVPDRVAALLG